MILDDKLFGERLANTLNDNVLFCTEICRDIEHAIYAISTDRVYMVATKIAEQIYAAQRGVSRVYFTGIGKPGFIAMKNAATLKSIAVDAEYLDACTAGHGDLGGMPMNSLVIAMSKSGKSTELLTLFKNLNTCKPGCKIILLTQNPDMQSLQDIYGECIRNGLRIYCIADYDVKELDGHGLIPSVSNILFEAFLTMAIRTAMRIVGDDVDLWKRLQRSHPSGTLQNKVSALLNDKQSND